MKVLAKDFDVQITPSECLVGVGQEIPFQALISRQSNAEIDSIKWNCSRNEMDCTETFANSSGLIQHLVFSIDGSYELSVEIIINGVRKVSVSKIEVDAKIIPHVQIKHFPSQPINVQKSNSIAVTILNLIPKCIAYWNVVDEEGFAKLSDDVEGNFTNMGLVHIKDFEEYFLKELVDYDNNTLSKDVTLTLQSSILKPNLKYKFRLTVICPKPVNDASPQEEAKNVTSFFDIVLSTNGPPDTLPLIVHPTQGTPMKTNFKFTIGVAKDLPNNFPLKYSFGYIVDNFTVDIGTFYEGTVATTQLPFSESIETFCDVCDNNEACARVDGPTVSAEVSQDFSDEDYEIKLEEFAANLKRAEYSESINTAVVLLLTQRKLRENSSAYEVKMLSMMKSRLEKLKVESEAEVSSLFHQENILDFVNFSKALMKLLTISDEAFVTELLSLTETIARSARRAKRTTFSHSGNSAIVNYDMDYIKNVLDLSEILLSSTNGSVAEAEREKFLAKVYKFIPSICQNKNLEQQTIDTKFVSLEVLKVYSPQLSAESQKFPGASEEATILYQQNRNFQAKYVCVAKIKFKINLFQLSSNDSLPVYEAIILDESQNRSYKEVAVNQFSDLILVNLPAASIEDTCFLMKTDGWSSDDCTKQKNNLTSRISCKCKTKSIQRIIVK